jgi:hypothetical protein
VLYWLISVVFGAGALLVPPVWSIVNFRHQNVSTRRWVRPPPFVDMDFPGRTVTAANFPAWLDHAYPLPPSRRFFSIWWRGDDWSIRYLAIPSGAIVLLLLAVVTWPWIICLVLMLLFQTRRRANVRRVHVMRCALYSADFAAWLGPACAALAGWGLWRNRPSRSW